MTHVVVIGAGLGGMPMAYEMKELLGKDDRVTVIGNGPNFHFVPSNPWLAVSWRARKEIEFPAAPYLEKRGIGFDPRGAKRVRPEQSGRARRRHDARLRLNEARHLRAVLREVRHEDARDREAEEVGMSG